VTYAEGISQGTLRKHNASATQQKIKVLDRDFET